MAEKGLRNGRGGRRREHPRRNCGEERNIIMKIIVREGRPDDQKGDYLHLGKERSGRVWCGCSQSGEQQPR